MLSDLAKGIGRWRSIILKARLEVFNQFLSDKIKAFLLLEMVTLNRPLLIFLSGTALHIFLTVKSGRPKKLLRFLYSSYVLNRLTNFQFLAQRKAIFCFTY